MVGLKPPGLSWFVRFADLALVGVLNVSAVYALTAFQLRGGPGARILGIPANCSVAARGLDRAQCNYTDPIIDNRIPLASALPAMIAGCAAAKPFLHRRKMAHAVDVADGTNHRFSPLSSTPRRAVVPASVSRPRKTPRPSRRVWRRDHRRLHAKPDVEDHRDFRLKTSMSSRAKSLGSGWRIRDNVPIPAAHS